MNKDMLKKELHKLGIKIYRGKKTKASYVKKSEIKRILAQEDETINQDELTEALLDKSMVFEFLEAYTLAEYHEIVQIVVTALDDENIVGDISQYKDHSKWQRNLAYNIAGACVNKYSNQKLTSLDIVQKFDNAIYNQIESMMEAFDTLDQKINRFIF